MSDCLDRRQATRHRTVDAHGIVHMRVRPGHDVSLIDASAAGALVETLHQLLPGSSIELQVTTNERRLVVRGHVLRCSVSRLRASGVWYCGAIGFDRHLPWFIDHAERGYSVPIAELPPFRAGREDISRPVL